MTTLQAAVFKALEAHGIGKGAPPKHPELWEEFKGCGQTEQAELSVTNLFFKGYDHEQLDWSRPVHALVVDFKGDSMQLGMIAERLERRGEQYVFVAAGNPGFNGGWHFSAVDDYEHPQEQQALAREPERPWGGNRVWTQVNYIASFTKDGDPALTPRAAITAEDPHAGAIPLSPSFRFAGVYLTGGLMPHTLVATAVADDKPLSKVLAAQAELGATIGTVGHGLDVLISCGTPAESLLKGFTAAVYPKQDRLLEINGMQKAADPVCSFTAPSGAKLVSASCWASSTAEAFLAACGLEPPESPDAEPAGFAERVARESTKEPILALDVGKMPGMDGPIFRAPSAAAGAPMAAVFVDDVVDPIEAYVIVSHLMSEEMNFCLVSHSAEDGAAALRIVTTETVFGNPMYGLKECVCSLPTTPANMIPADTNFDSFFVAGGQCPYQMQQDKAVTAIMDAAEIAAAVCHGAEALHGSKWLAAGEAKFTAYTGCWMSFRDVLDRFQKLKPGETCQDGKLFSGNAPNATKAMVTQACAAIKAHRGTANL